MTRGTWLTVGLIVAALVLGIAAGQAASQSPVPSALNPGPKGLEIARVWLEEAGLPVTVGRAPLTELPADVRALIIPPATQRPVELAEAQAVLAFAERGGTVLYLVDRETVGGALDAALGVRLGPGLPLRDALAEQGATVRVHDGALPGVGALSVSTLGTVRLAQDATGDALSEPRALWKVTRGRGAVWIMAGADVLENARLHRADNARFLAALVGAGPVWFDELRHTASGPTPLGRSLFGIAAQLGLAFLLVLFGVSRRLGPARPPAVAQHRSATEYVDAFAALTQRAHVDAELVEDVRRRQRLDWARRFGLPAGLSTEELAERVAPHLRCAPQAIVTALRHEGLAQLLRALDDLAPRPTK